MMTLMQNPTESAAQQIVEQLALYYKTVTRYPSYLADENGELLPGVQNM